MKLSGIRIEDENATRRAGELLRNRGVAITLGAAGSFLVTERGARLIPTRAVEALDTTAAGDAFNGALAYALAREESLEDAVRFANLAGAFSATKLGTQSSLPTYEEFCRFLNSEAGP